MSKEELVRQQSFITVERETLAQEREKLASTRSLSSMYIPDLKYVLSKKTRINTTSSAASSKKNNSVRGSSRNEWTDIK